MNKITKLLVLIFMLVYVVSPLDACPGPIDDLIILLLSIAAQRKVRLPGKMERVIHETL